MILGAAEAEDREEDRAEENETHREAAALSKPVGQPDVHQDRHDEADDRNQEQNNPPGGLPGDVEQYDDVVNRNDRCPPGFAGLGEDLPHRRNHHDAKQARNEEGNDSRSLIPVRRCRLESLSHILVHVVIPFRGRQANTSAIGQMHSRLTRHIADGSPRFRLYETAALLNRAIQRRLAPSP